MFIAVRVSTEIQPQVVAVYNKVDPSIVYYTWTRQTSTRLLRKPPKKPSKNRNVFPNQMQLRRPSVKDKVQITTYYN